MKKLILTDVDGVLLRWCDHFQHYIKTRTNFKTGPWLGLNHMNEWLNLSWTEVNEEIENFHSQGFMFATFPPYSECVPWVKKLANAGYRFIAITAVRKDTKAWIERKVNLEANFGPIFDEIHHVGFVMGESNKIDILKQYAPTWWVEDSVTHAEAGLALGHKAILINRPENNKPANSNIIRVNNWHEIYQIISKQC